MLDTLTALLHLARTYGDGSVLLTSRANVQVRGVALNDGRVPVGLVDGLRSAGLLPSDSHERVRNIVCSPLTGRLGGRADLRPVVDSLDAQLVDEPALSTLGGRFLFVLDDGRGDVAGRDLDLGLCAVSADEAQLRVGRDMWGPVVPLDDAPVALVALALAFLAERGDDETAWWHVDELPGASRATVLAAVGTARAADPRTRVATPVLAPGRRRQDDGRTMEVVAVADGLVTDPVLELLAGLDAADLVVTPWRSIVAVDLSTDRLAAG